MTEISLYMSCPDGRKPDIGRISLDDDYLICTKKEVETLKTASKNASADANMYADAWHRELLQYDGKVILKRHHVDSMVLTTKHLINGLKAAEERVKELEYMKASAEAKTDSVPGFVPDHVKLLFEAYQYGQFADDFNYPIVKPIRAAIRQLLDELLVSAKP